MRNNLPVLSDIVQSYTVLTEIVEQLNNLVPNDFAWVERSLQPIQDSREEIIGTISLNTTKALFVLAKKLGNRSKQFQLDAEVAIDDTNAEELQQNSVLFHHLSELIGNLFWFQCWSELGFWQRANGALRKGWQVVTFPDGSITEEHL